MSKRLVVAVLSPEEVDKVRSKTPSVGELSVIPCWAHSEWVGLRSEDGVYFTVVCPFTWYSKFLEKKGFTHPATGVQIMTSDFSDDFRVRKKINNIPEQVIVKLVASKLLQ